MLLSQTVSLNEALSGIFGSISLTAWICLLIPQVITNYRTKSADGLSMSFLFVWLLGDLANLSGALITGLAPTAIGLAVYFLFCDVVLITQSLYYNIVNTRRHGRRAAAPRVSDEEDEPLLQGVAADRPRRSSVRHSDSGVDLMAASGDGASDQNAWRLNALSLAAVYLIGTVGWFISYKAGAWDGPDVPDSDRSSPRSSLATLGVLMGYASALCYLCARIPQIMKNHEQKSCEGLAPLFFLLSLTGNLTYGLSVFSYSQERAYLVRAAPWMLGSLGTIVEDCVIFYQFSIYAPRPAPKGDDGTMRA